MVRTGKGLPPLLGPLPPISGGGNALLDHVGNPRIQALALRLCHHGDACMELGGRSRQPAARPRCDAAQVTWKPGRQRRRPASCDGWHTWDDGIQSWGHIKRLSCCGSAAHCLPSVRTMRPSRPSSGAPSRTDRRAGRAVAQMLRVRDFRCDAATPRKIRAGAVAQ